MGSGPKYSVYNTTRPRNLLFIQWGVARLNQLTSSQLICADHSEVLKTFGLLNHKPVFRDNSNSYEPIKCICKLPQL